MEIRELFSNVRDIVKNMHKNVEEAEEYAEMAHKWHACPARVASYKEMSRGHLEFNDTLKQAYEKNMRELEGASTKEMQEIFKMVFGEWLIDIDHETKEVMAMLDTVH